MKTQWQLLLVALGLFVGLFMEETVALATTLWLVLFAAVMIVRDAVRHYRSIKSYREKQ